MAYFRYLRNEQLPKLAWIADCEITMNRVTVICGEDVECQNRFFVAGVWDGPFKLANFDSSEVFCGSGGKATPNGIVFVTPSHALERLQYYNESGRCVVSNSFPCLMSYCNLELDPKEDQYESYFCSILDGLNKYKKTIPLKNQTMISQLIVGKLLIEHDGTVRVEHRAKQQSFKTFSDYYGRLINAMMLLRDNATSSDRKHTHFGMVSTISSGYDSTCCSTIAKQLGADTVVTFSGGNYDNDDGSIVAKMLGFSNIIKRDKNDFQKKSNLIDAEYISSGELGTLLQFCAFEDVFAGNLIFWGVRGSYWEKSLDMTEEFEMDNYFYYETDISWTENALKNGYINIPLPTFGASACKSIQNISNSKEMEAWMLHTKYDKPIPRRIVETAGIPREAFGQKKYGGGFYLGYETKRHIKEKMSKAGYESFLNYYKVTKIPFTWKRIRSCIKYTICMLPFITRLGLRKVGISLKRKQPALRIANPFVPSSLFFWSVGIMIDRYNSAFYKEQKKS